jgi:murein DD-endopeptidase MepM/ murein hydrolase activator NlpD
VTAAVDDAAGSGGTWKRWLLLAIAVVVILGVMVGGFLAVALGALAASAAGASQSSGCGPSTETVAMPSPAAVPAPSSSSASTGSIPDSLNVPGGVGMISLDKKQLTIAAGIIAGGRQLGVPDKGLKVALMVALQESMLRMYANSSVPQSLAYPHDAVGSDHDSLNPFQQRANWGSVAERMNLDYAVRAFFGGKNGPNHGSPRGLLDFPGWQQMQPGVAAQTVQVSAYPTAYNKWDAASDTLLSKLGGGISASGCGAGGGTISGEMALPLKKPYQMTSGYGPRNVSVEGASSWHAADDLQNWPGNCGAPVYAILPGKVVLSSALWLSIKHPDGFVVSYLHMYKSQRLVNVGDQVVAGQQIGVTGNVQPSGGCHLDLRINVAENTNPQVAKLIVSQKETRMAPAKDSWNYDFVNPEEFMRLWGVELCPKDWCRRL